VISASERARQTGSGLLRTPAALFAVVLTLCLAACGGSAAAHSSAKVSGASSLQTLHILSGGHLRTYLLYVPPGDSKKHRLPLVLVYHGADDTAAATTKETDLLNVAEQRHNMILAFMQGYDDTWNEGAGNTPAHAAGINDVNFTSAVLRRLESHYYVDLRRVVATGLSNGALLTDLLGCRLAPNLTLIVPVEGQLPVSVSPGCRPRTPISVLEVHGTDDQVIPYGGGPFAGVGGGTSVLSAPAAVARWATLDHCGVHASASQSGDSALTSYTGCKQAVTVTLDSIQGGQHQWPNNFGEQIVGAFSSLAGKHRAVTP
jgi:polyhydroxybutyrate depolymerase